MQISFEAAGPSWAIAGQQNPAFRIIHRYTQKDVLVPSGTSVHYSPWNIPNNAQPGLYYLSIIIRWVDDDGNLGYRKRTGEFYVPGLLATGISTFLSNGITPTSAAEPAGALLYKITVANTSYPYVDNTDVVLTDPLPPEIFDIIGTPTTDRGICGKTGSWPSTTVTCRLGSLAPVETATTYFMASIIVRDPTGEPQPPESFVNTVHTESDQQGLRSTSVKTLVTTSELTDADALAFLDATAGCVGLVPVIGPAAGWVWEMLGRDLATSQPRPYRDKLVIAVGLLSEELLIQTLNEGGSQVGLHEDVFSPTVTGAKCIAGFRDFLKLY
jgi:hypothetical protein